MERLPLETEKILRAFQKAKAGTLSVKKLKTLLPETDAYYYRIGQLSDAGFIAPSAWGEWKKYDIVIDTGAATAFCITVKGRDYLAMLDQDRKKSAKDAKHNKLNNARSEKQSAKDRRNNIQDALFSAAAGSLFNTTIAYLVKHFDQLIVWVKTLFSR